MNTLFNRKLAAIHRKHGEPRVVTFGEVMVRIGVSGLQTFYQTLPGKVDITFGGAEANVAASLAILGREARFVSALPENSIADACVRDLRGLGVDTNSIVRKADGRIGIYYLETGANQRPSKVTYDRNDSAICRTSFEEYDWDSIFQDADWFHITGITPALTSLTAECSFMAVKKAREQGLIVSCDLNYRNKLWKWDPSKSQSDLAKETMSRLLPYVDVLIANEEDAKDVLGIHPGSDVTSGKLHVEGYSRVASEIVKQFPNISLIVTTLRESISASHNNWGAMLFDGKDGHSLLAPMRNGEYSPYQISNIVDRVGGGDSMAAGLIFALSDREIYGNAANGPAAALSFAVAASCLSHSIPGDFNYSLKGEVLKLMEGDGSGRVQR